MSCICGNDRRRVSDGGTGSDVLLRIPGSKRKSFSGLKKYMTVSIRIHRITFKHVFCNSQGDDFYCIYKYICVIVLYFKHR